MAMETGGKASPSRKGNEEYSAVQCNEGSHSLGYQNGALRPEERTLMPLRKETQQPQNLLMVHNHCLITCLLAPVTEPHSDHILLEPKLLGDVTDLLQCGFRALQEQILQVLNTGSLSLSGLHESFCFASPEYFHCCQLPPPTSAARAAAYSCS